MMTTPPEFCPTDNPLHRDTATDTLLSCANHVMNVALTLETRGAHSTTLTIAAYQLKKVQSELLRVTFPLTEPQKNTIELQVDTLFRVVNSLTYRAGCEKHINIIHYAILALNAEIKTIL